MDIKKFGEDEYLAFSKYEGHSRSTSHPKFSTFSHQDEYYFTLLNRSSKAFLRSEGYSSEKARITGMESVMNNSQIEERWSIVENHKHFFLILKAANHKEISRSGAYEIRSAAEQALSFFLSGEKVDIIQKEDKEDDYLPSEAYMGHEVNDKHNNVAMFKHENGQFYFVLYNADGSVKLRSEGFETAKNRDVELSGVIKYHEQEDMYTVLERGKYFMMILEDKDGNEIGRSPLQKHRQSEPTQMESGSTEESTASNLSSSMTSTGEKISNSGSTKRMDDYLACKDYLGHPRSMNFGHFCIFENNGEFYFALMDADGTVKLRSEGYKSEKARDNGIESVSKNMQMEERWSVEEKMGHFFAVLKAGNHQEIGRSCPCKTAAEASWPMAASLEGKMLEETVAASPKSEKRMDDYLACKDYANRGTSVHDNFSIFEHEGEYYFSLMDADGDVKLRSEGYKSESARDNGIASVMKNMSMEERWSVDEKMGYFFAVLKAGNHQEIGRSCPYKNAADASWPMAASLASKVIAEEVSIATPVAKKSEKRMDDYLACKDYTGRGTKVKDNFSIFEHEGEYYFSLMDADGDVKLRSEGYKSESARDNSIASVMKNISMEERWSVDEKMGYFFAVLKAGNHQEIGRSCPCKTAAEASWPLAASLVSKVVEEAATVAASLAKISESRMDDYLACKDYNGHPRSEEHPDFSTFSHDGEFYFAMIDADGNVKLRSEGYKSKNSRDNGIKSVMNNRDNEDRWSIDEKMGYFFSVLKAGNNQEIGRSCPHKSAAAAKWMKPAAIISTAAALSAVPEKEVETPVFVDKEDDYLACKEYENRKVNDKVNNVALFKHDNGQFYFALYNKDGSVRLRSEGFVTAKERDEELSGVLKFRDDKSMYSKIEKGKYFMDVLKDKTGREVGRSCLQKIESTIAAAPIVTAAAAAGVVSSAKTEMVDKEDDYLPCKEYENRKINDKVNNVALFKHKNGQFYFALYNKDGSVRLRSEGFKTGKQRDEELSGVLKYRNTKSMYSKIEKGKYFMDVLKDKTGREVGRSCLQKVQSKVAAAPIIAAASAATAVVSSTNGKAKKAAVVAPLVTNTTAEGAAAATVAASTAASSGGFKLWWLLPLLLIPLIWFMWGGSDTPPPPPPAKTVVETPPPPPPAQQVTPPPVVAAPKCKCSELTHPVFKIPAGKARKTTTVLGRAPEYGNSHALDATGFYNKLNKRYQSSTAEKKFLDGIFRQMGYKGWSAATPDLFSEVTVPRGVSGNLGTKMTHKTVYRTLDPINAKDLEAFRIKALNTCDLHFMKTCGNHFFYKQCE